MPQIDIRLVDYERDLAMQRLAAYLSTLGYSSDGRNTRDYAKFSNLLDDTRITATTRLAHGGYLQVSLRKRRGHGWATLDTTMLGPQQPEGYRGICDVMDRMLGRKP